MLLWWSGLQDNGGGMLGPFSRDNSITNSL